MIDGSEKRNRQLAFELQDSHVCEKRSNEIILEFNRPFEVASGTESVMFCNAVTMGLF